MITIEEKLNLFSKHVFEDIKKIQEEKLKKIEEHNKEQMDEHRKRIEKEKREYAEKKIEVEKQKNDKRISQKKGQIKKDIMLKRNELFNELIDDITYKLREFVNNDEYKEYLKNSLEKTLIELNSENDIEVQISESDIKNKKYIKDIIKENGFKEENINIIESDGDIIGGVILIDKNNRISLDISLLEKLNESKEYIGNVFYETLDKVGEDNGE